MHATRVALLREVLASTGWVERTGTFAHGLCTATRDPGGLLLVGPPDDEFRHLAAHLDDEPGSAAAALPRPPGVGRTAARSPGTAMKPRYET